MCGGDFDIGTAAPRYRAAFAARGTDLTVLAPADSAARLTASDTIDVALAAHLFW